MEHKQISPVLRNMKTGDVEEYTLDRYSSLQTTINRLKYKGMCFSLRKDGDVIKVTKTEDGSANREL